MLLKQSTARNLLVFMTQSADHVTGLTGATLTITASKDGGAFASISPTVTERGNGWYSLALTSSHTDTLGDLAVHVTAASADPTDLVRQVVAGLPGEAVSLSSDAVNSSSLAASAVTEIQAGMATSAEVLAVPTAAENADALLARNIAGGSNGGRDVTSALRVLRNRVDLTPAGAPTVATVYAEDDTTPVWTATVGTSARDALVSVNPTT